MATYIIRAGAAGPVKIGRAEDVHQRLRDLQVGNPETLAIIRVVDTVFDAEPYFHAAFKEHHLRGEWFRFVPEMLTYEPVETLRLMPHALVFRGAGETATIAQVFAAAVRAEWGEGLAAEKAAAKQIGVGTGAVHNWLTKDQMPNGQSLIRLMAASTRAWAVGVFLRSRAIANPINRERMTKAVAYLLADDGPEQEAVPSTH